MRPPDESEVIGANQAFYDAFARRDAVAMEALWAKRVPVACVHPGWAALRGRRDVVESWQAILANPRAPKVACSRPRAYVYGEFAFVVCNETVSGAELVATNVFVREDGSWRMVHHHAGPVARGGEEDEAPPRGMLN